MSESDNIIFQLQSSIKLGSLLNILVNKQIAMERKEQLFTSKLRVQVISDQQDLQNRRKSGQLLQSIDLPIISNLNDQLEQPISPTFRKDYSLKSSFKEPQIQCFSFGQKMVQQLQHMLRQSGNIQKSQFMPICIQCQSFCSSNDKITSEQNLRQVLRKLSRFVDDTKYFIQGVKLSLKNYRETFESQKNYWLSYVSLILGNIDSKTTKEKSEFQSKIVQLQQQKNFSNEKSKLLQKRALTLQQQVTQIGLNLCTERQICQQMNKKNHELNQQLHDKITKITSLMEDNMNMKINLKKFMNYANEVTNNTIQFCFMNNCEQDLYEPKSRQLTQQNFIRSRKQSISSVVTQTNSNQKDFSDTITMNSPRNDQCVTKPISKRHSHQNPKILQERQKNYNEEISQQPEDKNKFIMKMKSQQLNSLKLRRNSQAYSNTSNSKNIPQRNNLTQTKKNDLIDKSKLMDRIKKLKEDINFQIRDLQSPTTY